MDSIKRIVSLVNVVCKSLNLTLAVFLIQLKVSCRFSGMLPCYWCGRCIEVRTARQLYEDADACQCAEDPNHGQRFDGYSMLCQPEMQPLSPL